jgi:hypothetical protein
MLTGWHWPMKHWLSGPQGFPHIPQLFGSLLVSVHPSPQHDSPPAHGGPPLHPVGTVQKASTQLSPAGHTLVQLPQCEVDVWVFTHKSEQQVSPGWQPRLLQPEGG